MTDPINNPQMPDDPGAPENTDEQYISPDQAEQLADEAAESAALDEDPLPDAELNDQLDAELQELLDDPAAGDAAADIDPDADGDGQVSDIELQLAERTESLQRVSAEYANYRRRTERERAALVDQTKAKFAEKLLPILDDLDLAAQHGDLHEGPLKSLGDKLVSTLEGQKLKAFGAEGDAFDPEIHEAVQDLSQGDEKIIGTVLRKGYKLGDQLVRNAMVIIADPAGVAGAADN